MPQRINLSQPINWQHPLNNGRLAWWLTLPQWMGGTTWFDLNRRYDGTLTNGPIPQQTNRPGGFGQLSLDGSNDVVTTTATTATYNPTLPHTISCWLKQNASAASGHSVVYLGNRTTYSPNNHWDGLATNPAAATKVVTYTQYDGTAADATATIVIGDWTFVTGVHDGTNLNIYTNGIFVASVAKRTPNINAAATLRFGSSIGGSEPYNGYLDDVSVWSRALSAAEARSLYEQSRRGYPDLLNRARKRRTFFVPSGSLLLQRRRLAAA